MSKATIKRFLMLLSSRSGIEQARLYQLVQAAERCYCLRNMKGQYEFGSALKLFNPPFDLIGEYYQAGYLYIQGHKDAALEILDTVREQAPCAYQDKSLLTRGGIYQLEGDIDESMKVRLAASKSETLSIALDAALGISALLGMEGKHDKAVEYLESVLPHASKLGDVPLQHDLYNSYATELAEIGKTEEAMKVIIPVINSRYVQYHPNWLETESDIREKSTRKSMITFARSNVIYFPVREVEEAEEVEEVEPEEPQFPHARFISESFNVQNKVEDWMYGTMEPEDFSTLIFALVESDDELERDMILEKLVDSTFPHTQEGKEAKDKWRKDIIAKIKDEMKKPEK